MRIAGMALIVVLVLWGWTAVCVEGAASARGTLTIGIPTDIATLDPMMSPEINTQNVARSVMEPLLDLSLQGSIGPRLAESWQVLDNVTYVFHLRHGVKFSNGEPFTSRAVEYSWHRSQEGKRPGRAAFGTVARMELVDDYTVRIITQKPDPLFLKRMTSAYASIFPPKYAAEQGDEAVSLRPVGTGPFVLVEWIKGDHATFTANPNYYLPNVPKVDTLVWRFIPESASRVAALRAGQVDIAFRIPPQQAETLKGVAGLTVESALSARNYYVGFNNVTTGRGTPIMDSRVRLAMNLGLDVQAIIKSVFNDGGDRANSLIGNLEFGYDPTLPPLPYDPARAKQLLAAAGYPHGFSVAMGCPSGAYPNERDACEAIAGYFGQRLGIQVDLQFVEANRYFDLELKHELPPLFYETVGDSLRDADNVLRTILHPGNPWTQFEQPEFTNLIDAAGATVQPAERKRLYAQLAREMQADPPAVFLWLLRNFDGVQDRVRGYTTPPGDSLNRIPFDVSVAH
jgi:peptide/nickel transport system substrate-binding protein